MWATKAALPWQLKDQKGHVLSLIYTLPWRSQHSCQLRQATPATVTPSPSLPRRATSRVSQICITNVSFSGCLTLHNPFQHANPLKVMARASTSSSQSPDPVCRPGTVSSPADAAADVAAAAASGRDGFISYFLWQHLRTICITKQTMRVVLFIGIQNLMPRPLRALASSLLSWLINKKKKR